MIQYVGELLGSQEQARVSSAVGRLSNLFADFKVQSLVFQRRKCCNAEIDCLGVRGVSHEALNRIPWTDQANSTSSLRVIQDVQELNHPEGRNHPFHD